MAKVPEVFNVGDQNNLTPEKLLELLQEAYTDLAIAINKKPDIFVRTTDGQTTDVALSVGDININSGSNNVEMLTNHTNPTTVVWTVI